MSNIVRTDEENLAGEIELTDAELEAICGGATPIANGVLSVPVASPWTFTSNGTNVVFTTTVPGTVAGTVTLTL